MASCRLQASQRDGAPGLDRALLEVATLQTVAVNCITPLKIYLRSFGCTSAFIETDLDDSVPALRIRQNDTNEIDPKF
jgi:hypothetical protein